MFVKRFSAQSVLVWAMLALALLALVGCNQPTATPTAIPPTATVVPATSTPEPAPTSTPEPAAPAPVVASVDDLKAQIEAGLTLDPQGYDNFQGVAITELTVPAGSPPLWMAHTYGFRSYADMAIPHFVAIYTVSATGTWQELGQVALECPTFVMDNGADQVNVAPQGVWIEVVAGTGAHSGCFDLLHFDGSTLSVAATNFNGSPGAGYVEDLNGDGLAEVVLDLTEPYVFCYACGVRLTDFSILRWTGAQLETVNLALLPDSAPAEARDANNLAVRFAQGWLWADAQASIAQAANLAPQDPTVAWNKVYIDLLATSRAQARVGAYPLLENLFYGDYGGVRDVMAAVGVDNLFGSDTPLILGTVAESWTGDLRTWIDLATAKALTADPELPMALFVRGWAAIQADPTDPSGPADIRRAAELAPNEPLFNNSVDLLNQASGPAASQPVSVERITFQPNTTAFAFTPDLAAGAPQGYVLGISQGQTLFVTASDKTQVSLLGPTGGLVPAASHQGDVWQFAIPATGDYTAVLSGVGKVSVVINIPPASGNTPVSMPAQRERIAFASGGTSAEINVTLAAGSAKGYVLGVSAGQNMVLYTMGTVNFTVLDPDGGWLTPIVSANGWGSYAIPRTGDYTIVLQGSGDVYLSVSIPPLAGPTSTVITPPADVQRVSFAPGTTGASVTVSLAAGQAKGLVLRVMANQQMNLQVNNATVYLLDPQNHLMAPVSLGSMGRVEYRLPEAGDYIIVVESGGSAVDAMIGIDVQ